MTHSYLFLWSSCRGSVSAASINNGDCHGSAERARFAVRRSAGRANGPRRKAQRTDGRRGRRIRRRGKRAIKLESPRVSSSDDMQDGQGPDINSGFSAQRRKTLGMILCNWGDATLTERVTSCCAGSERTMLTKQFLLLLLLVGRMTKRGALRCTPCAGGVVNSLPSSLDPAGATTIPTLRLEYIGWRAGGAIHAYVRNTHPAFGCGQPEMGSLEAINYAQSRAGRLVETSRKQRPSSE